MKAKFVRTKNVKNFITTITNLQNRAEGVPGMALVYGEPGLGKTQSALWWAANNDGILISAKQSMSVRWLLEDIVKELGETPFFRSSDLFEQIVMELIKRPRVLIVDEIDYLATDKCAVEMLRDIHDRTHNPIVLIGMSMADKKLKRYKHLYDRFSEILHFESFSIDDVKFLISELSEIKIADEVIQNIYQTKNRFRQIVKLINKAETIAKANDLSEVGLKELRNYI
jgi:DNA transposition AAA+ family ATPase